MCHWKQFAVAISAVGSILAARLRRIGQFHHIVEITGGFIASDVKERELAGMFAGDAFKTLDAGELALERFGILKRVTPDDLRRAQRAGGLAARQPDIAISTVADAPDQFVVGNGRYDREEGEGDAEDSPAGDESLTSARRRCAWMIHKDAKTITSTNFEGEPPFGFFAI